MLDGDLKQPRCGRHAKLTGQPCRNYAMYGQSVCRLHGGKSPQALAKAEDRLRNLVHPSVSRLAQLIQHADTDSVSLNAIRYVLDYAGFKPAVQAQLEQSITIRVIDEPQPIVIDHAHHLGNGRADR
jgi:hypothetical protein